MLRDLKIICIFTIGVLLLFNTNKVLAQTPINTGAQGVMGGSLDTIKSKTNNSDWQLEVAQIYFLKPFSTTKYNFDTSILNIHQRPFVSTSIQDLGNLGSPSTSLLYKPQNPIGLSLGYNTFNSLQFHIDSLRYYNTTKPYTNFTYNLGSKSEQLAQIFHTQNIKPFWNMAINYRKINSPGYYYTQRNNHDNFYWTTNYQSPHKHYELYASIIYNKQQHDENGGIISDSFLISPQFSDRKTIPTHFYNPDYSTVRSAVTTLQRDATLSLMHAYTLGRVDSVFNEDTSTYQLKITPRLRFTHNMTLSSQRYQFKDVRPDSSRYAAFFSHLFKPGDSVFIRQDWMCIDNNFLINGLFGKTENQVVFNVGVGNRFDLFNTNYIVGSRQNNYVSNYVVSNLYKEATKDRQWSFQANTKFYFTGVTAGDFILEGYIKKDFGLSKGKIMLGVSQQLNAAPYKYSYYQNQYWSRINNFSKESNTKQYASYTNEKFRLHIIVSNNIVNNFLYFDATQSPQQSNAVFSISQVCINKNFRWKILGFANELYFQQSTQNAPVKFPTYFSKHQLYIATKIFQKKLEINTGVEAYYNANYNAFGYSPFFNNFYYQTTMLVKNSPMLSYFFNFKIKSFRSYIMFDQLQQQYSSNFILAKGYAAQNTMIRFGFSWVMIN